MRDPIECSANRMTAPNGLNDTARTHNTKGKMVVLLLSIDFKLFC